MDKLRYKATTTVQNVCIGLIAAACAVGLFLAVVFLLRFIFGFVNVNWATWGPIAVLAVWYFAFLGALVREWWNNRHVK